MLKHLFGNDEVERFVKLLTANIELGKVDGAIFAEYARLIPAATGNFQDLQRRRFDRRDKPLGLLIHYNVAAIARKRYRLAR